MKRVIVGVFLAIAVSLLVYPVFAQEALPEVPFEWTHSIWVAAKATPIAILTALATCLVGYLSKTSPDKFRLENFLFTALISLAVGFVTVYVGWSYASVELWFANGFLTWYIWKIAKIAVNKLNLIRERSQTLTSPSK